MKTYFKITDNKRIDLFGEHWYPCGDEVYPGSTKIINEDISYGKYQFAKIYGKDTDRVLRELGDIGTLFHSMIETFLKQGEIHYQDYVNETYFNQAWNRMKRFELFFKEVIKEHFIIDGIEITTINKVHQYGGTIDLTATAKKTVYKQSNNGFTKKAIEIFKQYVSKDNFDLFLNAVNESKKPQILWEEGSKHDFDWKSSKQVTDSMRLQISSYAISDEADFGHIVCFPEFSENEKGYSHSILNPNDIETWFAEFIKVRNIFNLKDIKPLYEQTPIIYKRD